MSAKLENQYGTINIENEVIARIAGLTAIDCYGIVGMAAKNVKDDIFQLLKVESLTKGIKISVQEDRIVIDMHIIVEYGTNITAIAENVEMEAADFKTIIAAQSYGKVVRHDERRRAFLLQALGSGSDIKSVYAKYCKMLPMKRRVKMQLKAFVKLLPPALYFPIRKLLHSI